MNIGTSLLVTLVMMGALPLSAQDQGSTPTRSAPDNRPEVLLQPKLRAEILAMAEVDQNVRSKVMAHYPQMEPSDVEEMKRLDALHEKRMREIIAEFGWPGRSLVGADGSNQAWLIVQHCSLSLQEECLPILERSVAAKEATAQNYAYLLDRVRMHQGKPQVYGTQYRDDELYQLEDPEHVDERRRSVGLGSLAEYEKILRDMYKIPKKSAAEEKKSD